MKFFRTLALAATLLAVFGTAQAAAQTFFPTRIKGTVEVKFLPPAGGQTVQVAIDDQSAGTLPVTVYVLPGPHKFTFSASGEASKTLTYPVKGDTVVPSIFNAKAYPLTVNTNVPGAHLALDGAAFAGNTTQATAGNHTLTVSAPGYQSLSLPFSQPAQANILNLTLIANTFPLTVNTNVPGAQLALDGMPFAGNTTQAAPGSHTLTVSAPGYQSLSLPFSQPSQANILNLTLIANTFSLTVNTNVPGAQLALDGVPFAGNTTQAAPGAHTLTVSAPGFQSLTVPFNQPSKANLLNLTLVATTFPLTVNTNVPGASMAVDGVPFAGITTSITAGNHTLSISAPGYQSFTLPFVQPSQSNILNVTLIASTGTLTVNLDRLPKAAQAYKLFIDNAEVRGFSQALVPGTHMIRIQSGNLSVETAVNVTAGQAQTLIPSIQWELR